MTTSILLKNCCKSREKWQTFLKPTFILFILISIYMLPRSKMRAYCFCHVCNSVFLRFCPSAIAWNVNLNFNFSAMNARSLIFHKRISFDKSLPLVTVFIPCTWPLTLTYFLKTLTLLFILKLWELELSLLLYFTWVFLYKHLSVGTNSFNLWPWPSSLVYILKPSTLLIAFQEWMPESSYFTWIFLVIRTLGWY